MIRRPPRSTLSSSSAASDVYKRQHSSTGAAFAVHFVQVRSILSFVEVPRNSLAAEFVQAPEAALQQCGSGTKTLLKQYCCRCQPRSSPAAMWLRNQNIAEAALLQMSAKCQKISLLLVCLLYT